MMAVEGQDFLSENVTPKIIDFGLASVIMPCETRTEGFGTIAVAVAVKCLSEQRLPARLNSASTGNLCAAAAPSEARALRQILVCTPSLGGQNSAVVISRA